MMKTVVKKIRGTKFLCLLLAMLLVLTNMLIVVNANTTTADYKEYVTYVDSDSARITFESYCSSTYVYVHYKVNNGQDMNYLMSQSGSIWTYDVNGLVVNDVISYWFTYQTGSTQKDTTQWGLSYTHNDVQKVATPTFNPVGATYSSAQTVNISCATTGATIRYTTDGSTPTTSSPTYSGAITVSVTTTIKAIAIKSGLTTSDVGSATYNITNKVTTPTFNPVGATYSSAQTVNISCATTGATIRYTTDGSTPTSSSTVYSGALTVSSTTTIKTYATKAGMTDSDIATATYIIDPNPGDYSQSAAYLDSDTGRITFVSNCSSTYVYIHYKVNDGSDLNYLMSQSGSTWTYDVNGLSTNNHVDYWFTYQISGTQKDTGWFIYNHSQSTKVATPTFDLAGGTYNGSQTVNLSCGTTGATIRYTTDGSTPTTSSPIYSGAITVSVTTTIKALGIKSGMTNSDVASATYTITNKVATPTFTPGGGVTQTVTISCATTGATIRYTTDGSTPTTGSTIYSGAITVSNATTIKAIAIKSGMTNSDIATATYNAVSGEKFEPADGKCIITVGQSKSEMDDYSALSDIPNPGGYMVYTATVDAGGMTSPVDKGAGTNDFNYWAQNKPNTICQLGIDMTDYDGHQPGQDEEVKVAAGQRDANIRIIANAVKNSGKPVFVRIGYEADSPWNHYEDWNYIKAYRHVHDIFREEGAKNAAFVWSLVGCPNAAGPAPYNASIPVESWYPGDEYVDWVSISWFGWPNAADETSAAQCRADAVTFANHHSKPMMIAESTPRTYNNLLLTNSATWDNYFQKIFDFIAQNNVKMFCYINQNWSIQPIFSDPMWGDSRIQQPGASYIYGKWKAEVTKAKYLNESSTLYNEIGFSPNDPLEPKVIRPVYSLPGKIEAENWEDAFVISQSPNNDPGSTNPADRIMCWLTNESWTKYNVNATSTRNYTVSLRVSNGSGTATSATIKIDANTVVTVNIPATTNWDTYVTVTSTAFNITAGQHTATVQCNGGFNFNWLQFN